MTNPPSPPYVGPAAHTSAGSNKPIHRIVMHCTVSPCVKGGARATAAYFRSQSSGGSAHYVVDPGEAVQVVYDNVIAWHAPPNPNSIGIELTDSLVSAAWDHVNADRWADANHKAMLQIAAKLVAQLALAYGVPIVKLSSADLLAGEHGICGHTDVSQAWHQSTHWDPGPSFPWATFVGMVKAAARDLQTLPTPTPKPKPTGPVRAKRIKLGHPSKLKGQTEAFGDSDRGLSYFAKKGCAAADGNALPTSDGSPANTHYHLFQRHGFERIDGKPANKSQPVEHFSQAELHDLFRTRRGHYRIRPSIDRIELAFSLGMDYEFEVKDTFTHAAAASLFAQVAELRKKYPKRRVVVKALNGRPGTPVRDLRVFHEVGFPTLLTTHTPFKKTPAAAKAWVDEYRGFRPRWK